MTKIYTDEQQEDMTQAISAAMPLLNDDMFKEISKIERAILFRQFYFPGGVPVLLNIEGKAKSDVFTHWDPRYLEEYIIEAKQNGFHRHFLYYDGLRVNTINFYDASEIITKCIKNNVVQNNDVCKPFNVISILSGLRYMNKIESFISEYGRKLNVSVSDVLTILDNSSNVADKCDEAVMNIVKQSSDEFINENVGWQADDIKYAFDVYEYAQRWNECQVKYMEFKDKLWNILSKTNALNICSNVNTSINVGDVTLQQAITCTQQIGDIVNRGDDRSNDDDVNTNMNADVKTTNNDTDVSVSDDNAGDVKDKDENDSTPVTDVDISDHMNDIKQLLIVIFIFMFVIMFMMSVFIICMIKNKQVSKTNDI